MELNHRREALQASALPLSYSPIICLGSRTRTCGLLLPKQAFYQLNYTQNYFLSFKYRATNIQAPNYFLFLIMFSIFSFVKLGWCSSWWQFWHRTTHFPISFSIISFGNLLNARDVKVNSLSLK